MKGNEEKPWDASATLARAILHDRRERRKWMFWMTLVPLGMLAIGLWVIDEWIWQSPWRVLVWWGACAVATLVAMLFAVYDALAVVREERRKTRSDVNDR